MSKQFLNRYQLVINSGNKSTTAATASSFTITIGAAIPAVKMCRVRSAAIPLTLYNVNATNNKIYFIEDVGAAATATITPGNYTTATITAAIKSALDAASPNVRTYTVTYSATTWGFVIAVSAGTFRFLFATGVGGSVANSAYQVLGFAAADGVLAASQTSTGVAKLNYTDCLIIRSSIISGSYYAPNIGGQLAAAGSRQLVDNVLAVIPLNVNLGEVLAYESAIEDWKITTSNTFTQMDFIITDANGNQLDLLGSNITLVMEFV